MQNAITTLRIQNFKSIKDVTMKPRRVNLIVGLPNVGKSNILEAMSLLGAELYEDNEKFLGEILRYESVSNLFYDNDTSQPIFVESSSGSAAMRAQDLDGGGYHFTLISGLVFSLLAETLRKNAAIYNLRPDINKDNIMTHINSSSASDALNSVLEYVKKETPDQAYFQNGFIKDTGKYNSHNTSYFSPQALPRQYKYHPKQPHSQTYRYSFLRPPLGHNLLSVIRNNPKLRKEIAALFKPYGLNLVLRVSERKFEIQKQVDDLVYNYPYSSIADTLQRIIFYLAAIESNKDSVLLFEEPEAHSFPAYVTMLGQRMVESTENQFFVATHSPYLMTEIVEQMLPEEGKPSELAIFVAYYEDYQTKVKQLSDEEVREIRNDSIDVFYNLSRFTPGSDLYA